MTGKYIKAPLVYMSASIKITPFPELSDSEWKELSRIMLRAGFPIPEDSMVEEINFSDINALFDGTSGRPTKIKRKGYFSADRRSALIIERNCIELRQTEYSKYEDFSLIMEKILLGISDFSDAGLLHLQEVTLNYVDVIAPFNNRRLEDYFAKGDRALPLGLLSDIDSPLNSIGNIQLTKVVGSTNKIFFSVEQIPVVSNQIGRFMPMMLLEPDNKFAMPVNILPEWKKVSDAYYCLLTTQASMLASKQLKDFVFSADTKNLHSLVSKTFKDIINKNVCDADWEYSEH